MHLPSPILFIHSEELKNLIHISLIFLFSLSNNIDNDLNEGLLC
jgi:hypothetical protein